MNDLPVYEVLRQAAINWPHRPAVIDEYGTMTFDTLWNETELLKSQLQQQGITTGHAVGMKAHNGRFFIIGLFAIAGCGAAVMPIYHLLKKEETDQCISDAGLHFLLEEYIGITHENDEREAMALTGGGFYFSPTKINADYPFAPHVNQPVFVRFTSGTTGTSKGVVLSQQTVIDRITAANRGLELGPEDVVVWVLPMAYHFVVSIVLYVKFGAAIAVVSDFLARNIIRMTNEHNGTMIYASPLQIRLMAHDKSEAQLPSLKKIISTSAGIGIDVCNAFRERFGKDVSQAYGIIEIGLPMMNLRKSAEHPDAVGYALPGYDIGILDENYNPLPAGHTGYLGIRGPGMFDAYLKPARRSEEVFVNGYFLTADYASKTADGLVKIEGRAKSVINVSGIKVFPEEVEAVIETYPGILQAKVGSIPHPLIGQLIEAEIVVEKNTVIDIEKVMTWCRQKLSNFKAPQRIRVVDSLEMTSTGKLKR
jgi:long-chain acyl-CoA synthetase